MKIVLIGPVHPYVGGISQHTGLLCEALRAEHQVVMFSYKFLYPRFLFKRKQKDESGGGSIGDTRFIIHTANPFNWISSARKIRDEKADLIVVPWWHPYFAPCYLTMTRFMGKSKLVFVCHNVFPHERFPLDRFLTKWVLRKGDAFVVQSRTDEADLKSIKPDAVCRVNPHPTYDIFRAEGISEAEGRGRLGIGADIPMLLFFGFIREYKGLRHLLAAMPAVLERMPEAQLWVVGDFAGDRAAYEALMEGGGITTNVHIVDGYIPDREVENYFAAADLVVLPYESATQSGIVQIAYAFEKAVVVTDVGGLPEVVRDGETGFVVEARNPQALAAAIIRYFTEGRRDEFRENIRAHAAEFSWERLAEKVVDVVY